MVVAQSDDALPTDSFCFPMSLSYLFHVLDLALIELHFYHCGRLIRAVIDRVSRKLVELAKDSRSER